MKQTKYRFHYFTSVCHDGVTAAILSKPHCHHEAFYLYLCKIRNDRYKYVGDVVFEILAKTEFKFLCLILFLALSNPA